MLKRIIAIIFIFVCVSIAWLVLGATLFVRTDASRNDLTGRVVSTWGAPQTQTPPRAEFKRSVPRTEVAVKDGRKSESTTWVTETVALPLVSSRVEVSLDLEHRRKGLLWYSTYKVGFSGLYSFRNPADREQRVRFKMTLPAERAIYDDLTFALDDGPPIAPEIGSGDVTVSAAVGAGKTARLKVSYRSQGMNDWHYGFIQASSTDLPYGGAGAEVAQVRDFDLRMITNFRDIDFPENTLSPSEKRETDSGWELTWSYKNLVSGFRIGMVMPEKLQPGPLAGRISLFAPVSLFFFFFLMFIITTLRNIELHPMNYLFLGCAFFAFHLLMAYLVDHISIHAAFVICSAVSIVLVVTYLRLAVGMRFAAVEAGLAQMIYLVLFSYAFFFKGFTGLSIAIGSIVTLFVVMQMTGRVRWAEKFAGRPA
jgi:hypothetical protein